MTLDHGEAANRHRPPGDALTNDSTHFVAGHEEPGTKLDSKSPKLIPQEVRNNPNNNAGFLTSLDKEQTGRRRHRRRRFGAIAAGATLVVSTVATDVALHARGHSQPQRSPGVVGPQTPGPETTHTSVTPTEHPTTAHPSAVETSSTASPDRTVSNGDYNVVIAGSYETLEGQKDEKIMPAFAAQVNAIVEGVRDGGSDAVERQSDMLSLILSDNLDPKVRNQFVEMISRRDSQQALPGFEDQTGIFARFVPTEAPVTKTVGGVETTTLRAHETVYTASTLIGNPEDQIPAGGVLLDGTFDFVFTEETFTVLGSKKVVTAPRLSALYLTTGE